MSDYQFGLLVGQISGILIGFCNAIVILPRLINSKRDKKTPKRLTKE